MATSAPPAQLSPLPGTDLSREINYGRIARLFTDETTAELYERQAAMMERVCRHNADGYKLKHLAEVQAIMELAAARVEAGHELFTERLVAMIRLFGKPCVAVESNEHFRSGPALEGMVGALSCFLLLKAHPTVNVAAAEVLREFTRGVDPAGHGAAPDDLRTTMAAFHQGVLVRAGVLPAIVGALQVEVNELLGFDVNKDGVIDASELHAYTVANDGDAGNDGEAFDAAAAAAREDAVAAAADAAAAATADDGVVSMSGDLVSKTPNTSLALLLKLVRDLSRSADVATELTRLGVPVYAVEVLGVVHNFRDEAVATTVELLWNLLEDSAAQLAGSDVAVTLGALLDKHRGANAAWVLSTPRSVKFVMTALERMIVNGSRRCDKELRNDCMVVATHLARRPETRPLFASSGFLTLLTLYGCAGEMELPADAALNNFYTAEAADFEFKQQVWSLISDLCSEPACVDVVGGSMFTQTLVAYVDPAQATSPRLDVWSASQRRELELLAVGILNVLAPLCPHEFVRAHGHNAVLRYMRKHCDALTVKAERPRRDAEGDAAAAPLPHMEDGEGDTERQFVALRLVEDTCHLLEIETELGHAGIMEDLAAMLAVAETGGLDAGTQRAGGRSRVPGFGVTAPAGSVTTSSANGTQTSPAMIVEAVFACVAALCRGNHAENQDRFRKAGGIAHAIAWLRYHGDDAVLKAKVIVAVVAVVWDAVVGNARSEAKFLADGGMDALLDLLDVCPALMRHQVMGALADLLRNGKAHAYLLAWRSERSSLSAGAVVMRMWSEEENRLGRVAAGEHGVIASAERPLDNAAAAAGGSGGVPGGGVTGTSVDAVDVRDVGGDAGDGGGGGGEDVPPAFQRLLRALKASRMWSHVERSDPDEGLKAATAELDLRAPIFAVISGLGAAAFREQMESGAFMDIPLRDRVSAALALQFGELRVGAAWREVKDALAAAGVTPIAADAMLIESKLKAAAGGAGGVRDAQLRVVGDIAESDRKTEDDFLGSVVARKRAEEESARFIARAASTPQGMQEWLKLKRRKQQQAGQQR